MNVKVGVVSTTECEVEASTVNGNTKLAFVLSILYLRGVQL